MKIINEKRIKAKRRKINYIPLRYIFAGGMTVLELAIILGLVILLCILLPYSFFITNVIQLFCVLNIISSDYNPDYKVPWLVVVLVLPVIGFMLYFIFFSRRLKRKFVTRLVFLNDKGYEKDDSKLFEQLKAQDEVAFGQAKITCANGYATLFTNTKQKYFSSGEEYFSNLILDLKSAKQFIYLDYFIIKFGEFWETILNVLINKANDGVEVKLVYDDIGCMKTLPGNYCKFLKKYGIQATTFSRLNGHADNEFNNRNHRKIAIIDGFIGYTGGINIGDEYINKHKRFGHWKDSGIRLEGEAVWGLTKLFMLDYGINVKHLPKFSYNAYPECSIQEKGYVLPLGDGPSPIYERNVAKGLIQAMLSSATKSAYITTPYLIIDNDLCQSIEDAALRGVNVKIIVPHVPDKKLVFEMSKSYYKRFIKTGVKIYEYEPGFMHAKTYLVDDKYALVGTVNLDYRSLAHHFENGVWLYDCECIKDIKTDVESCLQKSIQVTSLMTKATPIKRLFRAFLKFFAPLM